MLRCYKVLGGLTLVTLHYTRLGNFGKVLATKLITKVAKKDCRFFAIIKKDQVMLKLLWIFLANLWKHLGNFLTPISGHTGCKTHKNGCPL